jgi:uncharacterized protein (TIGR02588 family)
MATRPRQRTQKSLDASKPAAIAELRSQSGSAERDKSNAIPLWEWVSAAIGLAIVLGVLGFLLYEAVGGSRLPPDVSLSIDSVAQSANGYLVKLTAINRGGSTAEGVIVEGELRNGSELVERSQTTLDYLPPHSKKRAGFFFTRDPRLYELQVRALGYEEP